jgi:hypothetical protein
MAIGRRGHSSLLTPHSSLLSFLSSLLSPQVTTKIQPHRGPCQLEVVKWLFDNRIFEKRLERKILLIKSMK